MHRTIAPSLIGLMALLLGTAIAPGQAAAGGSPSIIDTLWLWQSTALSNGDTFTPDDPGRYTLLLQPDGRAAVQADCNRGGGPYTLEGNRIAIGPLISTLIGCPPGSLGSTFLQQLDRVESYVVQDGDLMLELPTEGGSMRFRRVMPERAAVSGVVTYRERVALTPDAVVRVQIEDSSRADAPAIVISEQVIESPGQVPIAFSVGYDPAAIDPAHRYTLRARITDGDGRLLFINTQSYPVITRDSPVRDIEVLVQRAG
jgi:uncharacterized lipoprotein YbaY